MADGGPDALKEGLVSRTHSAVSMDSDQGASAGAAAKTAQKKVIEWRTAPPPCTTSMHLHAIRAASHLCVICSCTSLPTAILAPRKAR